MIKRAIGITALLGLVAGCSTVTKGVNQNVSFSGKPERHAQCKAKNSFGTYYVKTPGTLQVHRAFGDLDISCDYGKKERVNMKVASHLTPHVFGNIIVGGVIGLIIDLGTQTPYDYPDEIVVPMDSKTTNVVLNEKPVRTTKKNRFGRR